MELRGEVVKHNLKFKFDAGTSRGVLKQKTSYFIKLFACDHPLVKGVGESGPLYGLSVDFDRDPEGKLLQLAGQVSHVTLPESLDAAYEAAKELAGYEHPAARFALEVALIDLMNGGRRMIFKNSFLQGLKSIPINGLIWMGSPEFMIRQIREKIELGYDCLKLKIGAIDFEKECEILRSIRREFSPDRIEIRVDANGAFANEDVMKKLEKLAHYHIHSIEQPIAAGQTLFMEKVCRESPIPVALDEELIGIYGNEKSELINAIAPAYLILKPTLLGGLQETAGWIALAEKCGIKWWITSALESNIGLNAICQFAAEFDNVLPQGLGTGQLYHNNFPSPLYIEKGEMLYNNQDHWQLQSIGL